MRHKIKMFVCEFITGGGFHDQEIPEDLAHEGDLMLGAILTDLIDAGMTDITITRDGRLEKIDKPVRSITSSYDVWKQWQSIMTEAESTIIIAPENNNVLYELTILANKNKCKVIGCSAEAVRITSSKSQTYQLLNDQSISCVPTWSLDEKLPQQKNGWVIKPDDGVGGTDCYYFKDRNKLQNHIDTLTDEGSYIIQPYVSGIPGSLSLLCCNGQTKIIGCNEQLFEFDQCKGKLRGIITNGLYKHINDYTDLANQIASAIPGLNGYVGIDFILTENGPKILEINPRLTTSYTGIRSSLQQNPVEWLLKIEQEGRLPVLHGLKYTPENIMLD